MIILAYGIKQPTQGDRGSVFFPALEELCQRMATHNHDDVDSTPISSSDISLATSNAPSSSWVFIVAGKYSQNVTLPAGYTYSTCLAEVRVDDASASLVHPTIEKISETVIKIYAGTNLDSYKVYFK